MQVINYDKNFKSECRNCNCTSILAKWRIFVDVEKLSGVHHTIVTETLKSIGIMSKKYF